MTLVPCRRHVAPMLRTRSTYFAPPWLCTPKLPLRHNTHCRSHPSSRCRHGEIRRRNVSITSVPSRTRLSLPKISPASPYSFLPVFPSQPPASLATLAGEAGFSERYLQSAMRWDDPGMAKRYVHESKNMARKVTRKVRDRISGKVLPKVCPHCGKPLE